MNMERKKIAKMREEDGPKVLKDLHKELERLQGQLREVESDCEMLPMPSGGQRLSCAPVTPYNPIPGRRALAKSPRVSPAPAVDQSVDTKNPKPQQSRWHLIEVK